MNNIIQTKIKFSRNLKGFKFESNIDDIEQQEVLKLCLKAVNDCGLKCVELKDLSKNVIDNLLAREVMEREFVYSSYNQGIANDKDLIIQINNESHIEIIAVGQDVYKAYKTAKRIDKKLCNKLSFEYNDKYGFLNSNIKNIGNGITVKTKIILPALAKINAIEKLPKVNDKLVFDVVCFDRQSGLCEITTKGVLGYTEQQVCELVNMYNDKLLKLEIDTAKKLAESDKLEIDDGTRRAKAILKNCCKITLDEARVLVSKIILAINAEIEKEIKMEDAINVLNTLKLYENDYVALANEIQKILIK